MGRSNCGRLTALRSTATLKGHTSLVRLRGLQPGRHHLSPSGSETGTIKLVECPDRPGARSLPRRAQPSADDARSVAFSPDGHSPWPPGGGDQHGQAVGRHSGPEQKERSLKGSRATALPWCFSPDGETLAAGPTTRTIKLWNAPRPARSVRRLGRGPTSLSFALIVQPGRPRPWPPVAATRRFGCGTFKPGRCRHTLGGHTDRVFSVAFSPDGNTLASASADRTVRVWNVRTGQEHATLGRYKDFAKAVCFSPDGKTLASGASNSIQLWDASPSQERHTQGTHGRASSRCAFSPDSGKTLAASSLDKTIKLAGDITPNVRRWWSP